MKVKTYTPIKKPAVYKRGAKCINCFAVKEKYVDCDGWHHYGCSYAKCYKD